MKHVDMTFPAFADNAITLGRLADALLGRIGDPQGYEQSIDVAETLDEQDGNDRDRVEVLTDDIVCELSVAGYEVGFDFETRVWAVQPKPVPAAKVWTLTFVAVDTECYAEGPDARVSVWRSRAAALDAAKALYLSWTGDDELDEDLFRQLDAGIDGQIERGSFDLSVSIEEKEIGA